MASTYIWIGNNNSNWQNAANWGYVYYVSPGGNQYYESTTTPPGADDTVEFLVGTGTPSSAATITGPASGAFIGSGPGYNLTFSSAIVNAQQIDAAGAISIADASTVAVSNVTYTQGNGGIAVSGIGSNLATLFLQIGTSGTGSLNISSGATVDAGSPISYPGNTYLAIGSGGGANATVTGAGSSLTETGGLTLIGLDATATLTIENTGSASFTQADDQLDGLDVGEDGTGNIIVTGAGASLTAEGVVQIGYAGGHGNLSVLDGATTTFTQTYQYSPALVIGDDDSTGVVAVSGEGSTLTVSGGGVQVSNHGGTGTLKISNGGAVSILDSGALPPPDFEIGLGDGGKGAVNVDDASLTSDPVIALGALGGQGQLSLIDDATLTAMAGLVVGDDESTSGDPSSVSFSDDSTANTGDVDFGVDTGGYGIGTLTSGAKWTVTGQVTIGDAGQGSLTISNDGVLDIKNSDSNTATLVLGSQSMSSGALNITSTTLDVSGGVDVGDSGSSELSLYDKASMTISDGTSEDPFALCIGNQGGSDGAVSLDDASLIVGAGGVVVGSEGQGQLALVDDSTLKVSGTDDDFAVGVADDAQGVVRVDDAAIAIDGGFVHIGVAASGSVMVGAGGAFNLTDDATLSIGLDQGGQGSILIGDDGVLSLSDENVPLLLGVDDDAKGMLTLTGEEAKFDYDGSLRVGDDGVGDFYLGSGASWETTGDLTIAAGGGSSGSVYVGFDGYAELLDPDAVDGDGSTLSIDDLTVGNEGEGVLGLADDTTVEVAGKLIIGDDNTANGTVELTGSRSELDYDDLMIVGDDGVGEFDLNNGARFTLDDDIQVGEGGGSSGTINITGDGSSLTVDNLVIGNFGDGALNVGRSGAEGSGGGDGDGGGGGASTDDSQTIDVSENFVIGDLGGSDSAATIDKTATVTVGNELDVAFQGQATLAVAGQVTVDGVTNIGFSPGAAVDEQPTAGGQGEVTIDDGGDIVADDDVFLGKLVDTSGELDVTGADEDVPSSFTYAKTMTVGDDGVGVLKIDDGGLVSFPDDGIGVFNVGAEAGGMGTVTVEGLDSTLEADDLTLGGLKLSTGGTGTLTVEGGGQVDVDDDLTLGAGLQSQGTLDVMGSAEDDLDPSTPIYSEVDYAGTLTVGENGTGALNLTDGGGVEVGDGGAGEILIGDEAFGNGTIVVDGDKSELKGSDLDIGVSGMGALTIEDDATVSLTGDAAEPPTLDIAVDAGSSGTLTLEDDDSALDYVNDLTVGDGGSGKFDISDGASWSSDDDIVVAAQAHAMGSIDVSGDDSELGADNVTVGDDGTGTLTIEQGGSASFHGDLTLGDDQGSMGTLTVAGSGGADADDSTLDYGGTLAIGEDGAGVLKISGGGAVERPEVGGSGDIEIGDGDDGVGTVTVDGDDSDLEGSQIDIGGDGKGTVTLENGGTLTVEGGAASLDIAVEQGSTGTLTLDGDDSTLDYFNVLDVGDGGTGALNIKGGAGLNLPNNLFAGAGSVATGTIDVTGDGSDLEARNITVGDDGTGTLTVEKGASATADDNLVVADDQMSMGTVDVAGLSSDDETPSSLSFGATLTIGGEGVGALNVTGGGDVGPTANGTGTVDIGEGSDATATVVIDGDDSALTSQIVDIGDGGEGTLTIQNGGALDVVGGLAKLDIGVKQGGSGTLSLIGDGATLDYDKVLTVGDGGTGAFDIDSGASWTTLEDITVAAQSASTGLIDVSGQGSLLQADDIALGGTTQAQGGDATLTVSEGGEVKASTVEVSASGSVQLAGGSLVTDPMTIDSGGAISGYGSISGDIANGGSITASGGALVIDDQVGGDLLIDPGAKLTLEAAVTSDASVQFVNYFDEDLTLDDATAFAAHAIDGFVVDDKIDLLKFAYSGPSTVVLGPTDTLSLDNASGGTANLTFDSADIGATFTMTSDGAGGTFVEDNIPCYVRGTRILTARGEIAVEELRVGDLAVTASGARRPIVWLGRRRVDVRRHSCPAAVSPVRVSAGAFGEGAPHRDLWLSPGHNIAREGALMPISILANGLSVAQIEMDSVEYWHVELDAHDVLLAEGLPAESYLDCGNRTDFANGGAFVAAHPEFKSTREAETCLPLVKSGAEVERTKQYLIERLLTQGYWLSSKHDAHIVAGGLRVDPTFQTPTRLIFRLPSGADRLELRSRVFLPTACADSRELGLAVTRLQIDGDDIEMHRDQALGSGWNAAEIRDGEFARRWTKSAAPLPAGARVVIVDLEGSGQYWRMPEPTRQAS